MLGALCAALGALAAAVPDWIADRSGVTRIDALRGMFLAYGLISLTVFWLYRQLPASEGAAAARATPLGPSRGIVVRLAALFSVDAFAGGRVVNALLSLWLLQRFGLLNTMVFTYIPANVCLVLAALSPALSGALFAAGWISLPLIACGVLKIAYDLALWRAMRLNSVDGQ